MIWKSDGLLTDLAYEDPSRNGLPDTGSIGVLDQLKPGETTAIHFHIELVFSQPAE